MSLGLMTKSHEDNLCDAAVDRVDGRLEEHPSARTALDAGDCSTKCSETPDVKSFPVDVSILTLAMDANPVNEVVKLLPDFETKIQEARRPNNFTRVLCLV